MERLPGPPAVLATLVPAGTFSSSSSTAAVATVSNLGLHNQLVGLRWIAENIGHFCGNKDSVTIFGNSAGSKAVSGLLLSPLSAELFSRAILQSGMLLLPQSVEEALENVAKIAAYFPGCPPEEKNPETLLSGCLRRCCTEKLLNATRDSGVSLGPVYGDEVLLKRPVDLLLNKEFNTKVQLLFGIVCSARETRVGGRSQCPRVVRVSRWPNF
ncbi:Cocaine esterase [Tyrophagus putrescentiae]|nr:Cocaine esterase [Tyrophagus putrescentiae]